MKWKRPTAHRKVAPAARPSSPAGLGDVVEIVAKPIARVIDHALGTSITTCGGCASRRAALNQRFPFRSKPHS